MLTHLLTISLADFRLAAKPQHASSSQQINQHPNSKKAGRENCCGSMLAPMAPEEMEAEVLRQKLMDTRKL
jgi:hypothetical protein